MDNAGRQRETNDFMPPTNLCDPLSVLSFSSSSASTALKRSPNRDLRTREHRTEAEVERLVKATATALVWEQVDFRTATLHVRRVKQGSRQTRVSKSFLMD